MTNTQLFNKLSTLGLPFMKTNKEMDTRQALVEVVGSHDLRLWEAFPVLLVNAAKDYSFNALDLQNNLDSPDDRENYLGLLAVSVALYDSYHLRFAWANKLKKAFSEKMQTELQKMKKSLAENGHFVCGRTEFSSDRLKKMFDMYYEKDSAASQKKDVVYDRLALEYALSQLFSPKQVELLKKRAEGVPFTKTEKEYYSRAVKRKVSALANMEVQKMARRVVDGV